MKKKRKNEFVINLRTRLLRFIAINLFVFQRIFTRMKVINYPTVAPCIFALWHAHQCAIYSIKDHKKMYALISSSRDGSIVAAASEAVGLQTVRGSQNRNGTKAAMQLLEKLEQNNSIAMTIDGPRGPKYVVKEGVITIAKLSQVPIVPMVWYCPSSLFLKFNTWDEFRFAIFACKTIVLYGEPIYVPGDATKEDIEIYRFKLENQLKALYEDAQQNYYTYLAKK